ncbi:MAG: 30S ribosomal protein S8 [Bacteroidales bacterium]|nr:30S ribosomal protein S8 [Bacteroidales bacterium]
MTDPIADYLTRIRNAIMAKSKVVEIPASNIRKDMTKILFDSGYILNYKFVDDDLQGIIKIALKYNPENKKSAIKALKRVSRPGLRKYTGATKLPRVLNGLGIAILSTSQGVMTNKVAKKMNIGGEVLCYVQ